MQVIDKGIPGPKLLAYILASKYANHLPLNRQWIIFKRSRSDINDVTLNGWVKQTILLLQILCENCLPRRSHLPHPDPGQLQRQSDLPLAYLADVLDKLPARKVNNIDDFLP